MNTFVPYLLLATACVLPLCSANAQTKVPHRVVFELTSGDPADWKATLTNIENLQAAFGPADTEVEVVALGKGIGAMRASNAEMADRMKRLAASGVVFAACHNTMHSMHLSQQDLLPFVKVVDSGVAEVVRKQEAGWAYIKRGM